MNAIHSIYSIFDILSMDEFRYDKLRNPLHYKLNKLLPLPYIIILIYLLIKLNTNSAQLFTLAIFSSLYVYIIIYLLSFSATILGNFFDNILRPDEKISPWMYDRDRIEKYKKEEKHKDLSAQLMFSAIFLICSLALIWILKQFFLYELTPPEVLLLELYYLIMTTIRWSELSNR